MLRRYWRHFRSFTLSALRRSLLAMFAAQAAVIAGLIAVDAAQKHKRVRRQRFPRPGSFHDTVADNAATVYTYGEDLYAAMLEAIEGARHQILLETFIWKGDDTGARFRDAINDAAQRGVAVYVIYDGFANLVVRPSFYRFHPAVQVFRFPVLRRSILFTNIRGTGLDHRKLLVVDDSVGFVGGYNIGSLHATQWRDTHLAVRGPLAADLARTFVGVWNLRKARDHRPLPDSGADSWEPRIRTVNNIPANLVYPIRGLYLDSIDRAKHHIFITTAYFIPDQQILDALLRASQRGVDVRVLVPENSNHVVSDWLSRGFYSALLRAGVTILLYRNAMIHAKTATVDGEWSTIGTANIDRFSLTGNYEVNLEIFDTSLAASMERIYEIDSANSHTLSLRDWKRRHPMARISEAILIPLRLFL